MNLSPRPPGLPAPAPQRGAALIIGLILLLVLTVLAVSGVVTSTLELRQAGNQQQQEKAFQAADTAVERAMNVTVSTSTPTVVAREPVDAASDPDGPELEFTLHYAGASPALGGGSSLTSSLQAYHFEIDATGFAPGGAVSDHQQGFYIIGPGGTGGF